MISISLFVIMIRYFTWQHCISVYIFGVPFQQQETLTFYMMASALAGEKEELFLHYCSAVCEKHR